MSNQWLSPNPTNEDYHKLSQLGSSTIKQILKSPKHFKAALDGKIEFTSAQLSRFDIGTCMHSVVLEQTTDGFLCGPEVSSKAVKAWKEFKAEADDKGKIALTPDEYARILEAFEGFCEHPIAHKLVSQCELIEQSGTFKDESTGLELKIRPDGVCLDAEPYIFDYKSTNDLDVSSLERKISSLGYHISAAHYMAGVKAITGKTIKHYYLCFQEQKAPYDTAVFVLDPMLLEQAELIRRRCLNLIADAQDKNFYPGVSDQVQSISIPKFAWEKECEILFGDEVAS